MNMKTILMVMALTLGLGFSAQADEKSECRRLAPLYGVTAEGIEVVLWDRSRVDLLNGEFAYEVDWSQKWAEAIGQSVFYADMTGRKPAVILLVKDFAKEYKHLYRARIACSRLGIPLHLEQVGGPW